MRRHRTITPKILRPEDLVLLVDTREQLPLTLAHFKTETATLQTGDYSVQHLEDQITAERKGLHDLLGCIGQHRDRFERELHRLRAFRFACVVVEASWADLEGGLWRGQVTPASVIGSVLAWTARFVPFILAGDRDGCERATEGFLWHSARTIHRETQAFAEALKTSGNGATTTKLFAERP